VLNFYRWGRSFIQPLESKEAQDSQEQRQILSVSQLTAEIKQLLEKKIGGVWLKGEVSNLKIPSSGHAYFTLKDEDAQISAVLFRGRAQSLRFELADGMEVVTFGKVSLYEPRGSYQIIVEFMEPAGLGALQAAFEKLKEKLSKEGLFSLERKRPLPFLPQRIGIVTSATGAALRDMFKVLGRRHPRLKILLAPAKVQGKGAAQEVASQIENLNEYNQSQKPQEKLDFIIVGRGGGSLEDLWAFNEEVVARAIYASHIPIISAVGHEIDFTISDFVADVRAPTPSAAAEVAVPILSELEEHMGILKEDLRKSIIQMIKEERLEVQKLSGRLIRPDRRLADLRLRLDDWNQRLVNALNANQERRRTNFLNLLQILFRTSPQTRFLAWRSELGRLSETNFRAFERVLFQHRSRLEKDLEGLNALSPLKILGRGYSVVRDEKTQKILRFQKDFQKGQAVEIIIQDGEIQARILQTKGGKKFKPSSPKKSRKTSSKVQGQLWT